MELIEKNHVSTTSLSLLRPRLQKVVESPGVFGASVMVQTTFSGWSVTWGGKLVWPWECGIRHGLLRREHCKDYYDLWKAGI